jgi:ferredoxin like protein
MIREDKIQQTRFVVDPVDHILVDTEVCRSCFDKPCVYVCPVQNYTLEGGEISYVWEGCLECGACRIVCECEAIEWIQPRGGYGVCYRFG